MKGFLETACHKFFRELIDFLAGISRYFFLLHRLFSILLFQRPSWKLVSEQMLHIGVLSLPVVLITGFSTGLVLAAQSFFQLSDKGLASATGLMVAKGMFTELGPVLTAFMLTGRVGSAICAELGSMRVSEQIDALSSMAVDPLRYLVAPRFIAGSVMLVPLTVFSNLSGIVGAYLVSIYFFSMAPNGFYDPISEHITHFDFYSGLFKAFFFGLLITSISCYKGIYSKGGAAGVGRATTSSVVISYSSILLSNFLLTFLLNILRISLKRML